MADIFFLRLFLTILVLQTWTSDSQPQVGKFVGPLVYSTCENVKMLRQCFGYASGSQGDCLQSKQCEYVLELYKDGYRLNMNTYTTFIRTFNTGLATNVSRSVVACEGTLTDDPLSSEKFVYSAAHEAYLCRGHYNIEKGQLNYLSNDYVKAYDVRISESPGWYCNDPKFCFPTQECDNAANCRAQVSARIENAEDVCFVAYVMSLSVSWTMRFTLSAGTTQFRYTCTKAQGKLDLSAEVFRGQPKTVKISVYNTSYSTVSQFNDEFRYQWCHKRLVTVDNDRFQLDEGRSYDAEVRLKTDRQRERVYNGDLKLHRVEDSSVTTVRAIRSTTASTTTSKTASSITSTTPELSSEFRETPAGSEATAILLPLYVVMAFAAIVFIVFIAIVTGQELYKTGQRKTTGLTSTSTSPSSSSSSGRSTPPAPLTKRASSTQAQFGKDESSTSSK